MSRVLMILAATAIGFAAHPAKANGFCTQASIEFLQQVSGPWRVSHGTGAAFAGGMSIPYRSPDDAVIDFQYMPAFGIIRATGIDQFGEMLVVPSPSSLQGMVSSTIAEALPAGGNATCTGSSGPVLVGTTDYPNFEQVDTDFGLTACETIGYVTASLALSGVIEVRALFHRLISYISENVTCGSVENTLRSGGMTMRMIVRFSGADHGSGYLAFDGEANGHSFRAYTPITLSRS